MRILIKKNVMVGKTPLYFNVWTQRTSANIKSNYFGDLYLDSNGTYSLEVAVNERLYSMFSRTETTNENTCVTDCRQIYTNEQLAQKIKQETDKKMSNNNNINIQYTIDLVVTRHSALIEYLRELGICKISAITVTHADKKTVQGKHVAGSLPLSLSCECVSFTEIPLNLPLGLQDKELTKELSLEQIRKYADKPQTYWVKKLQ